MIKCIPQQQEQWTRVEVFPQRNVLSRVILTLYLEWAEDAPREYKNDEKVLWQHSTMNPKRITGDIYLNIVCHIYGCRFTTGVFPQKKKTHKNIIYKYRLDILESTFFGPHPSIPILSSSQPSGVLHSFLRRLPRNHPSPVPHCNLGIGFSSSCPLINHGGPLCIPK